LPALRARSSTESTIPLPIPRALELAGEVDVDQLELEAAVLDS